jgi:hypothetical protein
VIDVLAIAAAAPIRVVYLEDDDDDFETYSDEIKKIIGLIGFTPQLERARNRKELERLLKDRPHIIFLDMDLGKSFETEGLDCICDFLPNYPDVLFYLLTIQQLRPEYLASKVPNPHHFFIKQYFGTPDYNEYAKNVIRRQLHRLPLNNVKHTFDLKKDGPRNNTTFTHGDLISLVEQCLFGIGESFREPEPPRVELTLVKGGFSGSGVYLIHIHTIAGKYFVPGVLKISPRKKGILEFRNYSQFVKWRLPYLWRVDVLGTGETGNFAAVCYSFAMGGGEDPAPVNAYLRDGNGDIIEVVANSILHSRNQTWYAERKETKKDARSYFGQKPFYRDNKQRSERHKKFMDTLRSWSRAHGWDISSDGNRFRVFGKSFEDVDVAIFGRSHGLVNECVCHGDLNGNNIMYSGMGTNVVFIDFQDTGFWYQFRDFISFESSIRLELPPVDGRDDVVGLQAEFEMEYRLNVAEWSELADSGHYTSSISKIRRAAHQNFENEGFEIYVVANAVHSLWLFEKALKWEPYKQKRLGAAVLAALAWLDGPGADRGLERRQLAIE